MHSHVDDEQYERASRPCFRFRQAATRCLAAQEDVAGLVMEEFGTVISVMIREQGETASVGDERVLAIVNRLAKVIKEADGVPADLFRLVRDLCRVRETGERVDEALAAERHARILSEELDQVPPRLRDALIRYYVDGVPVEEICKPGLIRQDEFLWTKRTVFGRVRQRALDGSPTASELLVEKRLSV